MDSTSRLVLLKPNSHPVTGDFVDISVINGNMDKLDGVVSATPCTSGTRPGSPFQGQIILETDTGKVFVRSGSNWLQIPVVNSAGTHLIFSGLELNLTRAASTDTVLYGQVVGDSVGRLLIQASGRIEIGPGGAGGRDVNLYRGGTNILQTDDSLVVGGTITASAMRPVMSEDTTDLSFTNTVGAVGSPAVGVSFTAPPSGCVWVNVSGNIAQSTNGNNTYLSYELRTGTTQGSGTVIQGFSSDRALGAGKAVVTSGPNETVATRRVYVTGLTAGAGYNVRLGHWCNPAGSGTVYFRQLVVEPVV